MERKSKRITKEQLFEEIIIEATKNSKMKGSGGRRYGMLLLK